MPPSKGGLGICDLTATAKLNHDLSREATAVLTQSLLQGGDTWDDHNEHFKETTSNYSKKRGDATEARVKELEEQYVQSLPLDRRKACTNALHHHTHYALLASPSSALQTYLTPTQFHDALLVRYGREPRRVPAFCHCDCRTPLTLAHSQTCAVGGGVIGRHNLLVDELSHLCASYTATTDSPFSCMREEWLVRPGEQGHPNGLRSDVRVRGLDRPGDVTQIDVRVCHPAAPT